jgi:hypothetical protein
LERLVMPSVERIVATIQQLKDSRP